MATLIAPPMDGSGPAPLALDPELLGELLTDLVIDLAGAPDLWRNLAVHDPVERGKVRLLGTPDYEVWLLGWYPGQRVELHDHGESTAAFVVVEGELAELRADRQGRVHRTQLEPGRARVAPPGTIHDVINVSSTLATSLHAYAPPLTSMGFYPEGPTAPVSREYLYDVGSGRLVEVEAATRAGAVS